MDFGTIEIRSMSDVNKFKDPETGEVFSFVRVSWRYRDGETKPFDKHGKLLVNPKTGNELVAVEKEFKGFPMIQANSFRSMTPEQKREALLKRSTEDNNRPVNKDKRLENHKKANDKLKDL